MIFIATIVLLLDEYTGNNTWQLLLICRYVSFNYVANLSPSVLQFRWNLHLNALRNVCCLKLPWCALWYESTTRPEFMIAIAAIVSYCWLNIYGNFGTRQLLSLADSHYTHPAIEWSHRAWILQMLWPFMKINSTHSVYHHVPDWNVKQTHHYLWSAAENSRILIWQESGSENLIYK